VSNFKIELTEAFRKAFDAEIKILMGGSPRKSHGELLAEGRRAQARWEVEEAQRELYRRKIVRWRQRAWVFVWTICTIPVLVLLFIAIAALWQGAFR